MSSADIGIIDTNAVALLKVMHELFLASDNSQNIIRVLFIDFTKAFDVIDHNVLLNKFVECPNTLLCGL